jgi:hypothetical protein
MEAAEALPGDWTLRSTKCPQTGQVAAQTSTLTFGPELPCRSSALAAGWTADSGPRFGRSRLVRERRELDQLVSSDETGAGDPVLRKPQVAPEADAVALASTCVERPPEERLRDGRRGWRCVDSGLERIQRVALHEGGMQRREDIRAADVVEHDRSPAYEHERTRLPVVQADRLAELVEALATAVVDVVHRASRRGDVHTRGLGGNLFPHFVLPCSWLHAGGDARACGEVLAATQLRIRGLWGRRERFVAAAGIPASHLTQLTGTVSSLRAPMSTETSNVRFCCAPRTSSPSYSSAA